MASCGLDRISGRPIYDLDHVAQHVQTLFSTRLAEMIMLRWYGAGLVSLLGRRITPRLLAAYRMLLALAIDTWEPRLKVVRIDAGGNTARAVELGQLTFTVVCTYRPRALDGDFSVEGGLRALDVFARDGSLVVQLARIA